MKPRKLHRAPETEERFHEILAASLQLFAKHGYEKTSIDRIAREVHATKGLVYYYFKSKDEILKSMVEVYDFTPAISNIGLIDASVPLREALSLLIRGSLSVLDSRMEYVRFLYTEGQFMHRQSEALMRNIIDVWNDAVAGFLAKRALRGELRLHNSVIAAHQLTDQVLAYFLKTRFIHPAKRKELRGREYFEQWIDTFLNGLAPATQALPAGAARGIAKLLRDGGGLTAEVLVELAPALARTGIDSGLDASVHLCLTGARQLDYGFQVRHGRLTVEAGVPPAADVTLTLKADDLVGWARGMVTAAQLYADGRLVVAGSLETARRVGQVFGSEKPEARSQKPKARS